MVLLSASLPRAQLDGGSRLKREYLCVPVSPPASPKRLAMAHLWKTIFFLPPALLEVERTQRFCVHLFSCETIFSNSIKILRFVSAIALAQAAHSSQAKVRQTREADGSLPAVISASFSVNPIQALPGRHEILEIFGLRRGLSPPQAQNFRQSMV